MPTSAPSGDAASAAAVEPADATALATHEHGAMVQRMFDRIAPGYDRANHWMSLWTDVSWRRKAADALALDADRPGGLGAPPQLLDLCAGTMESSVAMHERWPDARIVAGDFSTGMLEAGRKNLEGTAAEAIEARQMDAHALPLETDTVDGTLCAFGARNFAELPRALGELARCMRPGARLVILELLRPRSRVARAMHGFLGATVLPWVGGLITGDREAYRYLPRSIQNTFDADTLRAALHDAGFIDVRTRPLSLGLCWLVTATRDPAASHRAPDESDERDETNESAKTDDGPVRESEGS